MKNEKRDISERLLDLAANVVKTTTSLNKSIHGRHISIQLVRSITSAGANYEEACAAQSRNDFVHKLQLVLKELRESLFWLRLAGRLKMIEEVRITGLLSEASEMSKIVARSIITTKSRN